jgi:hypothetical protein
MTVKDAHNVLMQAMQTALASGLFKDFQSVNVVQEALNTVRSLIPGIRNMDMADIKENGITHTEMQKDRV